MLLLINVVHSVECVFLFLYQHVLLREENWNNWKNNECRSYVAGKRENKDDIK